MKRNSWMYRIATEPLLFNWPEPNDMCHFARQFSFGFTLHYSFLLALSMSCTFSVMIFVGFVYELMMADFTTIPSVLEYFLNAALNSTSEMSNYYADAFFPFTPNLDTWLGVFLVMFFVFSMIVGYLISAVICICLFVLGCIPIMYAIIWILNPVVTKMIEKKPTKVNFGKVGEVHDKFCKFMEYE